jgi:hypothetical protein
MSYTEFSTIACSAACRHLRSSATAARRLSWAVGMVDGTGGGCAPVPTGATPY